MALSAGARLGSYEILSALGVGGMGEVYRARDAKLDRDVAIKVLLRGRRERSRTPRCASSAKRSCWPRSTIRTSRTIYGLEGRSGGRRMGRTADRAVSRHGAGRGLDAGRSDRSALARSGLRAADRRRAADREADRRSPRSRPRAGDHSPRSQAREHQSAAGRHGEGAGLRPGQGARSRRGSGAERLAESPTITTPADDAAWA